MTEHHANGGLHRRTPPMNRPVRRQTPRALSPIAGAGRYRIAVVIGTRAEAIKLAPVVHEMGKHREVVETLVVTTTQHRDLLSQALDAFGIKPHVDLGLPSTPQALADFTARALLAFSGCFAEHRPDLVLVQGDTTTVLCAALAAHYLGIPVAHVEAGLRTNNVRTAFPEELNRRLAAVVADVHFAPTERARENLLREGVPAARITVTGNTIVDALRRFPRKARFTEPRLDALPWGRRRVVTVTVHRREHAGRPLADICQGVAELASIHTDVHFVLPVHPNPDVREVVLHELMGVPRVELLDPLGYSDFVELLRRSTLAMTDSGGVQEECASLGRPVLVLRSVTERPEVVDAGFGLLVGTATLGIVDAASRLLDDPAALERMSEGVPPFGDGTAAPQIVQALLRRAPRRAGGMPAPEGPALLPPRHTVER